MTEQPAAPKPAFAETPEYRAALAEARAAAIQDVMAEARTAALAEVAKLMAEAQAGKPVASGDGNMQFVNELALAIAQISGQNNGKAYFDPKLIEARKVAREELVRLVIEARENKQMPRYQLTGKTVLRLDKGDQMVEPFYIDKNRQARATQVDWPMIPNDVMQPVNEIAIRIKAAYLASVGGGEILTADDKMRLDMKLGLGAFDPTLGITYAGNVVRGGAIPSKGRDVVADEVHAPVSGLGGVIRDKQGGHFAEHRILGTIASPALQTV